MMPRKYTVHEIDELRLLCRNKAETGRFFPPMRPHSTAIWQDGKPLISRPRRVFPTTGESAEFLLRSYLIAGLTAQDIREQCAGEIEQQKASMEHWLEVEKAREEGRPAHGDIIQNPKTWEITHVFTDKWLPVVKAKAEGM